MRNDGLDLVLDAITGPIVYTMNVKEGVDKGFLSQPKFRMFWTRSNVREESRDPNDLTRAHIYYNDELNRKIADLVNKAVSVMSRPTLILVEEIPQFQALLPYLRFEARFAHGGVTKDNKGSLPEQYHKSNPKELVAGFNSGEFPILVGTSCIATGTDIQATQAMFYLRGGKSETEVKQGVGRCTRLFAGKKDCMVFDFGIENVEVLRNHATARKEIYSDIYPDYKALTI
jgi:superfamily II DNA or RNA helicase